MATRPLRSIGLLFRGREPEKNEILAHEWVTLATLWVGCKKANPDIPAAEVAQIEALFAGGPQWSSGPEQWNALNNAEQRVGANLVGDQLKTEYKALLGLARARGLGSLPTHEANLILFEPNEAAIEARRAAYLSLLHDLQSGFINLRFQRRLRREVASRLLVYGIIAVVLAAFVPTLFVLRHLDAFGGAAQTAPGLFSREPIFPLTMVATFGILGAFFSRVIQFQTSLESIGFEEVTNLYIGRMLALRMLYGMIGAIIFYYIIRSQLIGGDALPDLSMLSLGEQNVTDPPRVAPGSTQAADPVTGTSRDASGLTILSPSKELAKLLVWSFLAGFAERLVPDTLERIEAERRATNE